MKLQCVNNVNYFKSYVTRKGLVASTFETHF